MEKVNTLEEEIKAECGLDERTKLPNHLGNMTEKGFLCYDSRSCPYKISDETISYCNHSSFDTTFVW